MTSELKYCDIPEISRRILAVGGRNNEAGYVEFGSTQAVRAFAIKLLKDQDTRATPDVQELVIVSQEVFYAPTREWRKTSLPDYYRNNDNLVRDLVDKDQAAAVIAAKDSELALKDTGLKIAMSKISALEAKLAQSEKQEAIGYFNGKVVFSNFGTDLLIISKCKHGNAPHALYASPVASDADLRAENERLRVRLNAAADDFDLIQHRIKDSQTERASATAWQGAKEARAALNPSEPRT